MAWWKQVNYQTLNDQEMFLQGHKADQELDIPSPRCYWSSY